MCRILFTILIYVLCDAGPMVRAQSENPQSPLWKSDWEGGPPRTDRLLIDDVRRTGCLPVITGTLPFVSKPPVLD